MNVLLPTDFSPVSQNALNFAIDFFRGEKVHFYLLNIRQFNFTEAASGEFQKELKNTLHKLQDEKKRLENFSGEENHHFNTHLSSENLILATRNILAEKKIDFIFIGAISHAEHHHPVLGNHSYEMVKKIRCKIVVVPDGMRFHSPKHILFPVEYSVVPEQKIQQFIENRQCLLDAEFTILEMDKTHLKEKVLENDLETVELPANLKSKTSTIRKLNFGSGLLQHIQKNYDMIFILGKNLMICDQFLQRSHGISANMELSIPIFVYHS